MQYVFLKKFGLVFGKGSIREGAVEEQRDETEGEREKRSIR